MVLGSACGGLGYYEAQRGANKTIKYVERTGTANPFNRPEIAHLYRTKPTFHDVDEDGQLELIVGNTGETTAGVQFFNLTAIVRNDSTSVISPLHNAFQDVVTSDLRNAAPAWTDVDRDEIKELIVGEAGGKLKFFKVDRMQPNPLAAHVPHRTSAYMQFGLWRDGVNPLNSVCLSGTRPQRGRGGGRHPLRRRERVRAQGTFPSPMAGAC